MIQLYCLHCNRPNDAEARFCCGCGTGLIRRFCPRCHALNGAEAHFCQACGSHLPLPPGLEAPRPDAVIPDLTDSVEMPLMLLPNPAPVGPLWAPAAGEAGALSVPQPALPSTAAVDSVPRSRHRLLSPAQLALGALVAGAILALGAAVSLWPGKSDHAASAVDAVRPSPAPRTRVDTSAAAATVVPMRDTRATTAGRPETAIDARPVEMPGTSPEATAAALVNAQKALQGGGSASRTTAVAAATAAPVAQARPRPVKPAMSTTPARQPDCTPEADALGLCAPGAKIIGRP